MAAMRKKAELAISQSFVCFQPSWVDSLFVHHKWLTVEFNYTLSLGFFLRVVMVVHMLERLSYLREYFIRTVEKQCMCYLLSLDLRIIGPVFLIPYSFAGET